MNADNKSAFRNAISTSCTRSHLATTSKQNHFKVRENQPTLHPIEYMKSCECGDTAFLPIGSDMGHVGCDTRRYGFFALGSDMGFG